VNALVYGSSLTAAFLGGILALLAPCCVVSVLPNFVAAALPQRGLRLAAVAGMFALGVATVLLPIVLGVGALSTFLSTYHREVFGLVGAILLALALYILSGRSFMLPMPGLGALGGSRQGLAGVFTLGVVSGVASSCCAPVLVGVVAITALASSIVGAAGLGFAYVFGMIFPLLLAAVLWERLRLGQRGWLTRGPRYAKLMGREIALTDLASGIMFALMGGLASYLAVTDQGTFTPGWLVAFDRWAASVAGGLAGEVRHVPAVIQAAILLVLLGGLVWTMVAGSRRTTRGG
jgi:cytochrome c biogenesis protein CcdA